MEEFDRDDGRMNVLSFRPSERSERVPESITTAFMKSALIVVMDSGLAGFARAPE
jgi:hypothetical protein